MTRIDHLESRRYISTGSREQIVTSGVGVSHAFSPHHVSGCAWIELLLSTMTVHVICQSSTIGVTLGAVFTDVWLWADVVVYSKRMFRFVSFGDECGLWEVLLGDRNDFLLIDEDGCGFWSSYQFDRIVCVLVIEHFCVWEERPSTIAFESVNFWMLCSMIFQLASELVRLSAFAAYIRLRDIVYSFMCAECVHKVESEPTEATFVEDEPVVIFLHTSSVLTYFLLVTAI